MLTVVKNLRFVSEHFRVNLLSAMEYRIPFLTQVVFMALNNVFLLFFWWVIFTRFDYIAGWQQRDVFLLYAVSAGSYGLATAFCGNVTRLSDMISEGQLDYYLALPRDVWLNVMISRSSVSSIGDFLFGLGMCMLLYGFSAKLLVAILVMVLSALVLLSVLSVVHSLTFFIGNANQFAEIFVSAIVSIAVTPPNLFPLSVRMILFTLIPAGFVTYIPASLIRDFSIPMFLVLFLGALMMLAAARKVFHLGLKRYESGNLLGQRM